MKYITLTVGNREINVNPTYSIWQWTLKKYDVVIWINDNNYYDKYIMDCIWKMMVRNKIFKPFVFKYRMKKSITVSEMQRLRIDVQRLLLGQDKISDEEFKKVIENTNKELEKKNLKP